MLVPRIIVSTVKYSDLEMMKDQKKQPIAIHCSTLGMERTVATNLALEYKKICLQFDWVLLVDSVEIAALVNADGVCCGLHDDMHGRAKDILGVEKLVGGTAHTIQDVATLYEEGMVDFIILESYREDALSENILGKMKAQAIIDDTRIMGYNIPIILNGGIDSQHADDAMSTGAYGIMSSHLADLESFKSAATKYRVR